MAERPSGPRIFTLLIERCSHPQKCRRILWINGGPFFKGDQGVCPFIGLHVSSSKQYICGTVLWIMLQSFLEKFDAIFRLAFSKQKLLAFSQRFLRVRRGWLVRRNEITRARRRRVGHVFTGVAAQFNIDIASRGK